MIGSASRTHSRVRIISLAALAVGGMAVALAPNAAATIPSTTTVSASPSSGTAPVSVTLTAKVSDAVVGGLIVTPSGTVTFSYTNGSSSGTLGDGTLNSCLLSACTATLTTSALPAGTNTVLAQYNGDGLSAPSSGTTTVTLAAPPPPPPPPPATPTGNSASTTCDPGVYCQAAVVSSNNSNTMNVLSTPSSSQQTVTGLLENGKNLHCPQNTDNQTGALGTFSVSVGDTTKTVTYTGIGNNGRAMFKAYSAHPTYAACFGSPTPFNGYVNGQPAPAQLVVNDGNLYEAQLPNCGNPGAVPPCFTNQQNADGSDSYIITTPMGDPPKIIG
jgi:hypothetical protein